MNALLLMYLLQPKKRHDDDLDFGWNDGELRFIAAVFGAFSAALLATDVWMLYPVVRSWLHL